MVHKNNVTLTFLGSGTSHGVPMIGCDCPTCLSLDVRDKRTNASLLITVQGKNILIDCGRDFRQQAIRHYLKRVDHVLITHTHFDHIVGMDDLRVFTAGTDGPVPVYGKGEHLEYLRKYIYNYLFEKEVQKGGGLTDITLIPVNGVFSLEGILFETLSVNHGKLCIYGYKFLECAYISDVSHIPVETMEKLANLEILIIDALRFRRHDTHFSLEEALSVVGELRPKRAYFTHICHDIMHREVESLIKNQESKYYSPLDVHLAYDGLIVKT